MPVSAGPSANREGKLKDWLLVAMVWLLLKFHAALAHCGNTDGSTSRQQLKRALGPSTGRHTL